jgi:hypothetical protein
MARADTADVDVAKLCALLDVRAARINADLQRHYKYTKVRWYLFAFNKLHRRHIDALRREDFGPAHDLLQRIHLVSLNLEAREFWRRRDAEAPGTLYTLLPEAFRNGHLITIYMDTPYAHDPYTCGKWFDEELLATVAPEAIVAVYAAVLSARKVRKPAKP